MEVNEVGEPIAIDVRECKLSPCSVERQSG